jgi:hypothetical protein
MTGVVLYYGDTTRTHYIARPEYIHSLPNLQI